MREGETIEGPRTMRNRPYPVLKCSIKDDELYITEWAVVRAGIHQLGILLNRLMVMQRWHRLKRRSGATEAELYEGWDVFRASPRELPPASQNCCRHPPHHPPGHRRPRAPSRPSA